MEKRYNIVDKETKEIVGELSKKPESAKSRLFSILGVVVGFMVFFIVETVFSSLAASASDNVTILTIITAVLYVVSAFSGAFACRLVCKKRRPFGVVLGIFAVYMLILEAVMGNIPVVIWFSAVLISCLLIIFVPVKRKSNNE